MKQFLISLFIWLPIFIGVMMCHSACVLLQDTGLRLHQKSAISRVNMWKNFVTSSFGTQTVLWLVKRQLYWRNGRTGNLNPFMNWNRWHSVWFEAVLHNFSKTLAEILIPLSLVQSVILLGIAWTTNKTDMEWYTCLCCITQSHVEWLRYRERIFLESSAGGALVVR